MFTFAYISAVCWIILIVVWLLSALGAKRNVRSGWTTFIYIRIAIALVIIFIVTRLSAAGHALRYLKYAGLVSQNPAILAVGAILCVVGVAFAIWARVYLGRNWGMPMSLKEDPELVTTGPYAFVRHPIYAGFLLAMIGSVITISILWLFPLILYAAYFLYSAPIEEKIMTKQFPDSYPIYKKRTKMLIPFIF